MIKIGRRGSLTARITVHGTQGHIAYPQLRRQPDPPPGARRSARCWPRRSTQGSDFFEPTTLQVTGFDVGNAAIQRHPGRRAGDAQHPLQRPAHQRRADRSACTPRCAAAGAATSWTSSARARAS